jgi:hypothetical protein
MVGLEFLPWSIDAGKEKLDWNEYVYNIISE